MESALKIIDAIYRGVSPQELAREYPWEEIVGDSSLELLNYAQNSPDNQQSFQILAYLFRVANGNDLWFATDVLSQTVRHPILSADERKMILANLRSLLDKIKSQNSAEPLTKACLRKFWLMEGGFYTVSGGILAEAGRVEEANQHYLIAQRIFEQLGLVLPGEKNGSGGAAPRSPGSGLPGEREKTTPNSLPESRKPAAPQTILAPAQPPDENTTTAELETFHSLPDVWFENGKLHLPEVENMDGDEIRQQAMQIEQQSEILAGIQLQIQMYLSRRSVLAKEVQALEKRTAALKTVIARQEKKTDLQEDKPG